MTGAENDARRHTQLSETMKLQNAMLTGDELDQVSGGQPGTPVFRTVLDTSAASTAASGIVQKRDELQLSVIRKL